MQNQTFTIPQLYKSVNDILKSNLSMFKGLLIEEVSIDSKLSLNKNYSASFYTATSISEKNKNHKINIQIDNSIISKFIEENEIEKGIKLDVRIKNLYITANGTITIQASEIKEAGLSNREIKNKRLKKYIKKHRWERREKKTLPRVVSSVYAITSASSDIQADILDNLNAKEQKIVKCESSVAIAKEISSDIAQGHDIIVLYRGGHEDANMDIFSDEVIINSIVESRVPICTALGHQTDMPFIAGFSDINFSTPSEFAKNISSKNDEVRKNLYNNIYTRIKNHFSMIQKRKKENIEHQSKIIQTNISRMINNITKENKARKENINILAESAMRKKKITILNIVKNIKIEKQKIIEQKCRKNRDKAKKIKEIYNNTKQKVEIIERQKRKEKKIISIAVLAIIIVIAVTIFILHK